MTVGTTTASPRFEERVAAVAALGFTPRQARFLTVVALHSGYCLRRQYAAFAGVGYGKNVRAFLDGLVDRQLARNVTFRADRGLIYHLFARSIYTALDQEDNRNRRYASPALVARKLMLLDFVLEHLDRHWYVTEGEKVGLFAERLGVPGHALPRRRYDSVTGEANPTVRYFVHKLPIFLADDPTQVHLVCLVTDPNAIDVTLFVRDHRALLSRLPSWTLVAVRPAHVSTDERCRQQFDAALQTADTTPHLLDAATTQWFFQVRQHIERSDLKNVPVADIKRYRELHERLGGRIDALYSCWHELGNSALQTLDPGKDHRLSPDAARLVVYKLAHRYEQFGALPGLS